MLRINANKNSIDDVNINVIDCNANPIINNILCGNEFILKVSL